MKKYIVKIKPEAKKFIKKLNPLLRVRIAKIIDNLEFFDEQVKYLDIKKLHGFENLYRLRIGKYRILLEKNDDELVVLVIKIGARGDIYKDIK